MKKQLIFGLFLFFIVGIIAQTVQNKMLMKKYIEQWKQVEKYESDDLPKSASKVVDEILSKAMKEKNVSQTIKALIYKNKYKIDIDSEEGTQIFGDLEKLLIQTTKAEDKALLHSMLAELYSDYYNTNSWTINQRTELADFVPDDMKEWSTNIFYDKIVGHLSESVKEDSSLLKVTTKSYEDIIDLGSDSQAIYPTLYDFLMKRAIEQSMSLPNSGKIPDLNKTLKSHNIELSDLALLTSDFTKLNFEDDDNLITLRYFSQYLKSLIDRRLDETVMLTELDRNNYQASQSETYRNKYSTEFLLALEKKYQDKDYNVEVISALIDNWGYGNIIGGYNVDTIQASQVYGKLKAAINRYSNYRRINLLKSKLIAIETPSAQISGEAVYHPNNNVKKFKLRYRNLQNMSISVINKDTKKKVWSQKIELKPKTSYLFEEKEFTIDLTQLGNYDVVVEFDKKQSGEENKFNFRISELAYFSRKSGDKEYEFYVVDRITGAPVANAEINIYSIPWSYSKEEYSKLKTIKTDTKGFAICDLSSILSKDENQNYRYLYTVKGKENDLSAYNDLSRSYWSRSNSTFSKKDIVKVFTDRSIYRPGQTIYFKAVATQQVDEKNTVLLTNKQYKVSLYNANRQLISEQTLKTNEFGSIAGEFVLPQGGLSGRYRIEVGGFSEYVNVEEYKRPTFQITFDKLTKTYAFGDKVTIIGHAENFSGIKIQNADVNYSIIKSSFFRWWSSTPPQNIEDGTVTTKENGSFEITFTIPQNDSKADLFGRNVYNFQITASVTDMNGETQSENYNFAVGDVSMVLSTDIPDKLDKNLGKSINISAQNLNGQSVDAKGTYTIYSVLSNDSINKAVISGLFVTGENKELVNQLQKLSSDKYLLVLKSQDDKGQEIVSKNYFILYSLDDKRPPIKTNDWFIEKSLEFSESEDASIIIGVSAKDATILFDLMKEDKVYSRQQIKLSNENKPLSIPYKKEYGDNISAVFTYVIDEVVYQKQVNIVKKEEIKKLNLKWEVFRDKLRPGQKEEWRISVKDNQGKPALAELLASMYDSSLDKLRSTNPWSLSVGYKNYTYPSLFGLGNSFIATRMYSSFDVTYPDYPSFNWDAVKWFGFNFYGNYLLMENVVATDYAPTSTAKPAPPTPELRRKNKMVSADGAGNVSSLSQPEAKPELDFLGSEAISNDAPQIRSNFNETAFFYPQLRTNEKGETVISFIVPESNTTWKFRALAYDKSLNIGQLDALAVSRKELMVTPNMPRFIRQGDKTSISTKISNLSDKTIQGKVRIEFFDPLTDKIQNISIENQYQDFSLEKDASSSASWLFDVPADIDLLGCRIIAESESFSDGEQHVISVLPNKMLVTESMTMNLNGQQTKEFTFDKLVNNKSTSLTNYRLTFEYAGNPAWYAVQALSTLNNPSNENVINWFASYYVNTLGASIVKQYPKVSAMINAWKKQGGDKETLVSKLQKNEELKAVLLEETPWVLDAKNEKEQMERLSMLFDLNNTNQQTQKAIEKLKELQRVDGGWSWYKGMYSSRSITQYILYGFTQLIHLNAVEYPQEVKMMQMNALKFIDGQILKDYEDLKKNNKKWSEITSISTNQLEYLYVRSSYRDIPIDQPTREAERFYTSVVQKNWQRLSLYERSLLVVLLQRNGDKELVDKIMQSIREHATQNDEMGMFWANNRSHVFMSLSAISVHTFVMDAFKETNAPQSEIDMMKQWLLKQKQTQIWETTHATIDAIYALLSTGSDWFSSSDNSKITINKEEFKPQNKELDTGYIKETWNGNQISNNMGKVTIQKSDNGPAWGAMYWQYFEDLDKITTQKGELNVDKKLFVEKNGSLNQITETSPIKVGDKVIVRLTVRVDRDMEFVHLKDMRGSCFEPSETISTIKWQNGTYYYQSTKDASTNFFFDHLVKGTYVFEYSVYANRVGEYANGITTIQCMYAPEFVSHTNGIRVSVK